MPGIQRNRRSIQICNIAVYRWCLFLFYFLSMPCVFSLPHCLCPGLCLSVCHISRAVDVLRKDFPFFWLTINSIQCFSGQCFLQPPFTYLYLKILSITYFSFVSNFTFCLPCLSLTLTWSISILFIYFIRIQGFFYVASYCP